MLVLMDLIMFLLIAETQQRSCFDIIIHTMNIRIGMMDHIMLLLPHMLACT